MKDRNCLMIHFVCYDLQTAETELQNVLNYFEEWCDKTGYSFSTTKTKILICHRKRRIRSPKINLLLKQTPLECVLQYKFLGIILDSKLTWVPYLKKNERKSI